MRSAAQEIFDAAVRHHLAGRISEAVTHYQRALGVKPHFAEAHSNLGLALAAQGKMNDAVAHYKRAIALKPDYAEAHNNLGLALAAQGRIDDAGVHFARAIRIQPELAEAHSNLGRACKAQGRVHDAIAHYERAIILKPDYADAHNNLGIAYTALGRIEEAAARYARALAVRPGFAEAYNNLGLVLNEKGKGKDAVAHYERALVLKPDYADAHNNLGMALAAQGRVEEAMAHYVRTLALNSDHAEAHNNLGVILSDRGQLDDATAHFERAIAINPDHALAHNNLGNAYAEKGKFDDAMAHYGQAIAIRPDYAEAHYNRADVKTFQPGEADLATLETLAVRNDLPPEKALYVHFALAKALDDSGDYARAFKHMRNGNALKRGQMTYDEHVELGLFRSIAAVFDSSLFERFRGEGDPSSVPVFVLGMPRSGSTLIEQILASHPQIHAAGELPDLEIAAGSLRSPECISGLDGAALRRVGQSYLAGLPALADGKARIVDKSPQNFLRIGLIRLILPNAKIIRTIRDPIDTCVSCYSKLFTSGQPFSYDLGELGRYYRGYEKLMDHWRCVLPREAILDVSYEDVVDDFEGQARRLIDYCGLAWDDRCLSFYKTNRTVKTASAVQVRKPVYRSSLQRWRRYEAEITPLLQELAPQVRSKAVGA